MGHQNLLTGPHLTLLKNTYPFFNRIKYLLCIGYLSSLWGYIVSQDKHGPKETCLEIKGNND